MCRASLWKGTPGGGAGSDFLSCFFVRVTLCSSPHAGGFLEYLFDCLVKRQLRGYYSTMQDTQVKSFQLVKYIDREIKNQILTCQKEILLSPLYTYYL